MSRIAVVIASVCILAASTGCQSYVGYDKYARDVETLKETNRELTERNEKLESIAAAYDRLAADYQVEKTEAERYDEIAKLLAGSLEGIRNDDGTAAMHYDARRGVWTMATDLLFDSGSFTISPKGLEILKKFGDAYKAQDVRFRVVANTDNARIASAPTKERLETDTNLELSAKRAIAVFGQLLKSGLKESRFVEVIGMGNLQPAAANDSSAANRRKNRRVEI